MKREATDELVKWKHSDNRKPMLIRDARQVGKTWIMKAFGSAKYARYANGNRNYFVNRLHVDLPAIGVSLVDCPGEAVPVLPTIQRPWQCKPMP